jgi:hypothetical protein
VGPALLFLRWKDSINFPSQSMKIGEIGSIPPHTASLLQGLAPVQGYVFTDEFINGLTYQSALAQAGMARNFFESQLFDVVQVYLGSDHDCIP